MPEGDLEFLGRLDSQVKIRGYRVELGEIESEILQTGIVNEVVVLAKDTTDGFKSLISYYVPDEKVVKEKEVALYDEQVNNWKQVYETEYTQTEKQIVDEEFDIGIWNDSFIGEPIPRIQMEEWVDDIVKVISPDQAGEVLEIGCGTGLIYYRLAGKVKKYTGTDFSQTSVNQIKRHINKGLKEYGPTVLLECPAHEVSLKENEKVDTVVINSVIQYFPGESYMTDVIGKSLAALKEKGRIIIGDVRDYRLLLSLKQKIILQKLQSSASIREFKWAVDTEMLKEEELCFSPQYFYDLQNIFPQITHVDIQWKQASYLNELSLYRYTVIIYVGGKNNVFAPSWQSWKTGDKQSIMHSIQQQVPVIALKNLPNPRLWQDRLLSSALTSAAVNSISDLTEIAGKEDKESEDINETLSQAVASGYSCRLLLHEDPMLINVLLELTPVNGGVCTLSAKENSFYGKPYTNVPLFGNINLLLQKEIRQQLQQRLPGYMIPSEFYALHKLPLTANNKTDRRFLASRKHNTTQKNLVYQEAQTDTEKVISGIWQELLGIERVGMNDEFFELGGHSLLAMRVISAIRTKLEVELVIRDIFKFSTIADLSKYVEIKRNIPSENISAEEFDVFTM